MSPLIRSKYLRICFRNDWRRFMNYCAKLFVRKSQTDGVRLSAGKDVENVVERELVYKR